MNWIGTKEDVIIRADLLERFEIVREQDLRRAKPLDTLPGSNKIVVFGIFRESKDLKYRYRLGSNFISYSQAVEAIAGLGRAITNEGSDLYWLKSSTEE